MPSSGILRGEALVIIDVSEEPSPTIIRMTRNCELGTTLAVTIILSYYIVYLRRLLFTVNIVPSSPATLMMEAIRPSETPVLTRATRRNIPEDGIVHSRRREHLKTYTIRKMPGICDRLRLAMRRLAAACIWAGGGHMQHLL
jgi:hypothetical protein